jgi:hypothetical protein
MEPQVALMIKAIKKLKRGA